MKYLDDETTSDDDLFDAVTTTGRREEPTADQPRQTLAHLTRRQRRLEAEIKLLRAGYERLADELRTAVGMSPSSSMTSSRRIADARIRSVQFVDGAGADPVLESMPTVDRYLEVLKGHVFSGGFQQSLDSRTSSAGEPVSAADLGDGKRKCSARNPTSAAVDSSEAAHAFIIQQSELVLRSIQWETESTAAADCHRCRCSCWMSEPRCDCCNADAAVTVTLPTIANGDVHRSSFDRRSAIVSTDASPSDRFHATAADDGSGRVFAAVVDALRRNPNASVNIRLDRGLLDIDPTTTLAFYTGTGHYSDGDGGRTDDLSPPVDVTDSKAALRRPTDVDADYASRNVTVAAPCRRRDAQRLRQEFEESRRRRLDLLALTYTGKNSSPTTAPTAGASASIVGNSNAATEVPFERVC